MMKLGSFIAGGLLGAAVACMCSSSKGRAGLKAALRSSKSMCNEMLDSTSEGAQLVADGLKKFKQMITDDSELKQTIKDLIKVDEPPVQNFNAD
ncbi:YtxH domain-containing protein [Paenibacillus albiflavus]|uniref:YtxH domain-containing protein n=1 Tax=Paenibacillus albiflavus TaxID=2545760 RepID=A0A4R4ERF9_9BACL|nr:YtxH domain-containing protein [Paenibacillus albiflavus]TCZ81241.1 YtxH domain-containing protein [Paenibacillus albiflavus]